jgi:hypothetical protein
VAFKAIDDDAFPLATDDGPHASGAGVQLQQNVKAIHDQRFPRIGKAYPTSDLPRLCSIEPVAWGPYWIKLDPRDQIDDLLVRLWGYGDWSNGDPQADGVDAIDLAVTAGDALGNVHEPQAVRSNQAGQNPVEYSHWERVLTASAPEALTFAVRLPPISSDATTEWTGWTSIWLWTWSLIDQTVEYELNLGTAGSGWGAIEVDDIDNLGSKTNPPERAIRVGWIWRNAGAQDVRTYAGGFRQVGAWEDTAYTAAGTNDLAYVIPPVTGPVTDDAYTTTPVGQVHTMGVYNLYGLSVEAVPAGADDTAARRLRSFFPPASAFYTDEPVSALSHQTLAERLDTLTAIRVPQWATGPPVVADDDTGTPFRPWALLSEDREASLNVPTTTGTAAELAAVAIANPPPSVDRNGLVAIASYVLFGRGVDQAAQLNFRLTAYQWDDTLIVAGSDVRHDATLNQRFSGAWRERWIPIQQTIWGSVRFQDWQFRGALVGTVGGLGADVYDEVGSDFSLIHNVTLTLAETSLTYPCYVKLECWLDASTYEDSVEALDLALIGFGLASKALDD